MSEDSSSKPLKMRSANVSGTRNARLSAQHLVDLLPRTIKPPLPEIIIDRFPSREIMGHHPPT